MEFTPTEDQTLLAQSLARCLAPHAGVEALGALRADAGRRATLHAELAALGLCGLPLSEEDGGFGGTMADVAVVSEALARALVPFDYAGEILLAAGVLARAGDAALRAAWLPQVAAGEKRLALAHAEPRARHRLDFVEAVAEPRRDDFVLTGAKAAAGGGDVADAFIVSARLSGAPDAAEGLALFLVPRETPGLNVTPVMRADGVWSAQVVLDQVVVGAGARLGAADALGALADAHAEALCAQGFATAALMGELLDLTVEYLKTRKQFGVAIGSFQALQHRAADMFVALESARSLAFLGLCALEEAPARRDALLSGAKAELDRLARDLAQQAIQLHGGIGMTMEYRVGHLVRRLAVIGQTLGDRTHHLALAARKSLLA